MPDCDDLTVILDSGGGDIDAAYNIAKLLRRRSPKSLTFIVPRWAKSAATLLACAGKRIEMSPVAELGPMDPQITTVNALEGRHENFSPLHIESTLTLIREEFESGSKDLARSLVDRLQFPLTLGSFKQSLELSKQYLTKLLSTGMLSSQPEKAAEVAKQLSEGYADHGFCINLEEARELGLTATEIPADQLDIVWEIHVVDARRSELIQEREQKRMREILKDLPPGILDRLGDKSAEGSQRDQDA